MKALLEYFKANKGSKNLVVVESDQLFFRNMQSLTHLCRKADIGFTFTNEVHLRSSKACMNLGILYIREVKLAIVSMFGDVLKSLELMIEKSGCRGGMDQNAFCEVIAGYIPSKEIKLTKRGVKVFSIPRDTYNPKRISCSPKGALKHAYLSHFVC